MGNGYDGPLRAEPLAVELHNSRYASNGRLVDGLAAPASAGAFLRALGDRLPRDLPPGPDPGSDALVGLRDVIGAALHAAVERRPQDAAVLAAISRASGRAPTSPAVVAVPDGAAEAVTDFHGASRADAVLAAFARSAIELLTGPERGELRACGAPGCVLLYLRDHPRRAWCSNACGNRARQARHYRRARMSHG